MKPLLFVLVFLLLRSIPASADEIRVAVASNFAPTLKALALVFEKQSEHRLVLASGSSGKHYAQISHGAPFDLFFAADAKRPQLLERKGLAIVGSRFTYAYGKLVLWQPHTHKLDYKTTEINTPAENPVLGKLKQAGFRYLAIANPKLAPYGKAAEETLVKLNLWDTYQTRIVRGENIAQAFHFVTTGNAQLGFIAYSQIKNTDTHSTGSYWDIPAAYYQPITQQAVILKHSPAAVAFMTFMRSPVAIGIIHRAGYLTPTENRP